MFIVYLQDSGSGSDGEYIEPEQEDGNFGHPGEFIIINFVKRSTMLQSYL